MSESTMSTDEAADVLGVARHEVTDVRNHAGWLEALHHDMASHEESWRRVAEVSTPEHVTAAEEAEHAELVDSPEVPEGSVATVLEWVNGNADRARQAAAVEKAKDAPRATLLSALEKLAG